MMTCTATTIGQASGPEQLVVAIQQFAAANGWETRTNNAGTRRKCAKDGIAVSMLWNAGAAYNTGYVGIACGTGFDGADGEAGLLNSSSVVYTYNLVGPFVQHWLYAGEGDDGPYIHCVVEANANVFMHMGFGRIEHRGDFDGGEYAYRSSAHPAAPTSLSYVANPFFDKSPSGNPAVLSPSTGSRIRFSVEGSAGWFNTQASNATVPGTVGKLCSPYTESGNFLANLPAGINAFNGIAPLWPLLIAGPRPDALSNVSIYGHVPDMRFNAFNTVEPRGTLTYGNDKWRIFPFWSRDLSTYNLCYLEP